jgi:hypothetical protein
MRFGGFMVCFGLLSAVAIAGPSLEGPREARASVSVRLSLEQLVSASRYVVVAVPEEHRSVWEDLAGGRRIVTYTKLRVERAVVGAPEQEVWVRTLGGVVDKIGQYVAGEAALRTGERSVLFLADVPGALVVTGLGQGHYPLTLPKDGPVVRLRASAERPALVPRPGPTIGAAEVLVGASLDDAIAAIVRAKKAQDGGK